MDALQIFTNALEKATTLAFVSAVTYVPMSIPAYKEFTFTLKSLDGRVSYVSKYKKRVTNDEEKASAIEKCTEIFIAEVIKDIIKRLR